MLKQEPDTKPAISSFGRIKKAVEKIEHIGPDLETDGKCEITLGLNLPRNLYLMLARASLLDQAIEVEIKLPQSEMQINTDGSVTMQVQTDDGEGGSITVHKNGKD